MEERKLKRKSPNAAAAAAAVVAAGGGGSRRKNVTGDGGGGAHAGTQRSRSRRGARDKPRPLAPGAKAAGGPPAAGATPGPGAPIIQHSFLTDVSDVQEMEKGLLGLLNDFHSGKLQAFGNECSMDQMEQVREMQEELARLHFELYGEEEEQEEQQEERRPAACDGNMDRLLTNLEELSSSIQKLNLADSQEIPRTASI